MKTISRGPDGLGQLRREGQPLPLDVAVHQFFQARLVDGHAPATQHPHLGLELVHANHVVARLGQARSDDQTDIPGPDNGNLHPALGSQ